MTGLLTTGDRIAIARTLPRRLQRRCDGLDPVSLRLAFEAMRVPEQEIMQCAPPPIGIGGWMPEPDIAIYPAPTAYPNLFQWLEPTAITSSGGNVTSILDNAPNNGDGVWPHTIASFAGSVTTGGSINGLPGLVYAAGANSNTTNGPAFTTFFKCTLLVVISPNPVGRVAYEGIYDNDYLNSFFLGTDSMATNWQFNMRNTTGPLYGNFLSALPISVTGGPQIVCATYDGSITANGTATISVNGQNTITSQSSGPANNNFSPPVLGSASPIAFGGRVSAGGITGVPGTYGDGLIYTAAMTGIALTNLIRYEGSKYGIAVP